LENVAQEDRGAAPKIKSEKSLELDEVSQPAAVTPPELRSKKPLQPLDETERPGIAPEPHLESEEALARALESRKGEHSSAAHDIENKEPLDPLGGLSHHGAVVGSELGTEEALEGFARALENSAEKSAAPRHRFKNENVEPRDASSPLSPQKPKRRSKKPRAGVSEGASNGLDSALETILKEEGVELPGKKPKRESKGATAQGPNKSLPPSSKALDRLGRTIHIYNCRSVVTNKQARQDFGHFGKIEYTEIPDDGKYIKIRYKDRETALKAVEGANDTFWNGDKIRVQINSDKHRPERQPSRFLFVYNVPLDLTDAELQFLFGGDLVGLTNVNLVKDRETGKMKGQVHVDFDTVEHAVEARKMINMTEIRGKRPLRAVWSNKGQQHYHLRRPGGGKSV